MTNPLTNPDEIIKQHYQEMGKKGGIKIAERGPDYFRNLQAKSVKARKKNAKKSAKNRAKTPLSPQVAPDPLTDSE